ncbi:ABC transporter permease [Kribbella sp.]|uniref:ABC transporter permease n=1 Tax=Kribbella sp. TaxID=1871183 RepID=UPI002D3886DA|nr:ABC transporter permease [Kribbella sp.]HZX07814.1 ABC transporter permease [Kribbella sp.]
MLRYVLSRLLFSVVVLLGISVLLFALVRSAPGDPVDMYFDPMSFQGPDRAAAVAAARAQLGLDKPLPIQFLVWLGEALQGNLGRSLVSGRPVSAVMLERLQNSSSLMLTALLISLLLGIAAGLVAALKRNTVADYALSAASLVALSIPVFFLSLIGMYFFGVKLGWLPTAGMNEPGGGVLDGLRHLILPATILGVSGAAAYLRWGRASMLDVLDRDFMVTARSKGLSTSRVILRHGVHNALIPLITVVSMQIPTLFSGAVVVEQIFAWPGMGRFAVDSISARDYPAIMGFVMFVAVLVVLCNLIADVLYAIVDPRIRL